MNCVNNIEGQWIPIKVFNFREIIGKDRERITPISNDAIWKGVPRSVSQSSPFKSHGNLGHLEGLPQPYLRGLYSPLLTIY